MFRKAIELKPDNHIAYINLGSLLASQQKLALAEACFRTAVKLKEDDPVSHYSLGLVLSNRQEFAEAEAAYGRAIRLNPDYFQAHANLGVVQTKRKKLDAAVGSLREADRLAPNNANIQFQLRMSLLWQNLEKRQKGLVDGSDRPVDGSDALAIAEYFRDYVDDPLTAVRFYLLAFAKEPKLSAANQFAAARCAAQTLHRVQNGELALDVEVCYWLSDHALFWLRDDLSFYSLTKTNPQTRLVFHDRLRNWQTDDALACVRLPASLSGFPASERQAWKQLWAEVGDLVKRLEADP